MDLNPAHLAKGMPKWGWYVVGGTAAGGAVLVIRKRKAASGDATGVADSTTAGDPSYNLPVGQSPGLIVPPVIVPQPADNSGSLFDSFIGATQSVTGTISDAFQSVLGQNQSTSDQLLGIVSDSASASHGDISTLIQTLANAGPPPQPAAPAQVQPAPVVNSTPYVAPAPARSPAPAPAFKTRYENRTRDNGKSGSARKSWCNRVTIHDYPDGRSVVASEDKIHDGSC